MKRTYILSIILAVAVLTVVGCINYDQVMALKDDGSGVVKIHYTNAGAGMEGVPDLPFAEDDIVGSYAGSGVNVYDVDIIAGIDDENANPEAVYYVYFKDAEDLNGYGIFEVGDDLFQTISIEDDGDERVFSQTCIIYTVVEEDTDLSPYEFNYTLKTPTPVTSTNGTLYEDGYTVSWSYWLGYLIDNPVEMTVRYEKP
ncbi:MAG: hypothetical protein GY771_08995 [bacterium]|nr:hypothetical protein [bacterium]